MTSRTHDLAAFTTLAVAFHYLPLMSMTPATFLCLILANFIGGLAPDLDEPTSKLWQHIRGGTLISRLISPLFGGHRYITHSLIGLTIAGYIFQFILYLSSQYLIIDQKIVWNAFMIGVVSHLVSDMMTKEGVPLLFPLPINFGIPPIKLLRITTGERAEKYLVFPLLVALNVYLFSLDYHKIVDFFTNYIHT